MKAQATVLTGIVFLLNALTFPCRSAIGISPLPVATATAPRDTANGDTSVSALSGNGRYAVLVSSATDLTGRAELR